MKKFFATLAILFIVLCLSASPVQAKWKGEAGAGIGGHFGRIQIALSAYTIDLVGEVLVPGWTGTFDVTVTNTGSISVVLSYESVDKPAYLTITTSIDLLPPTLAAEGGFEVVIVDLAIANDISTDLQDQDMDFTMTFIGDQV